MKNKIMKILEKDYSPLEKVLIVSAALLVGAIIGFCVSPVKKGVSIGSNNNIVDNSGNDEDENEGEK